MARLLPSTLAAMVCTIALAACGQAGPTSHTSSPSANAPALALTIGGATRQFTAVELLARSDVETVEISHDPAYGGATRYRSVPLRALLQAMGPDSADTMEIRATDGFVAQLPRALIDGASTPWVAIEDPAHPWPRLPGKTGSAGPFYLVWREAEQAGISPEQWPYAMAALRAVASPVQRWPAIAVDASVPARAPARRGQRVFIANCLTCHRLSGAGEGTIGPDLLRPMPTSSYFTDAGLRALIRNPAAVRTWPEQRMPAFEASVIGDTDVDAVIAYLRYLAQREHRSSDQRQRRR